MVVQRTFESYGSIQDIEDSNLDRYKMSIIGDLSEYLLIEPIKELSNLKDKRIDFPTKPNDYIDGVETMFIYDTLFALPPNSASNSSPTAQLSASISKLHLILSPIEILLKSSHKNLPFLKSKYFNILSTILLKLQIPSYTSYFSTHLLSPFSQLFPCLPQSSCPFPSDPLFCPTHGSLVKSVNSRYDISIVYLSLMEHMGRYKELRELGPKVKGRGRGDGRVSAKVIDRRLYKRLNYAVIRAMLNAIEQMESLKRQAKSIERYRMSDLMHELYQNYYYFTRKENKKLLTMEEREVLFDWVFKLRNLVDTEKENAHQDIHSNVVEYSDKYKLAEMDIEWITKNKARILENYPRELS